MKVLARLLAMLILGVFLPTTASANELAWGWKNGEKVRYRLETVINMPYGTWFLATNNLEARANESTQVIETTCVAQGEFETGWDLRCQLDKVRFSGMATPGDEQKLARIFKEYNEQLNGKSVEFELSSTGRIRAFKLKGVDQNYSRSSFVFEQVRLLLLRSFGLLELELPRKGTAKGDAWKQGGTPVLLTLRSSEGTAGGMNLRHSVKERSVSALVIESDGRATVSPGGAVEAAGSMLIGLRLSGTADFDIARRLLLRREYIAIAEKTVSSNETRDPIYYREMGLLEMIRPAKASEPARNEPTAPKVETAPAPPVRALPTAQAGPFTVVFQGDTQVESAEVSCAQGGFRERVKFENNKTSFPSLPAELCVLHLKGPVAGRFEPVTGGMTLRCYFQGSTAICEDPSVVVASPTPPPPAPLELLLQGGQGLSEIELVCPSNFRKKLPITGDKARFEDVPQEPCSLTFRGLAQPLRVHPVRGGERLACVVGTSGVACSPQ